MSVDEKQVRADTSRNRRTNMSADEEADRRRVRVDNIRVESTRNLIITDDFINRNEASRQRQMIHQNSMSAVVVSVAREKTIDELNEQNTDLFKCGEMSEVCLHFGARYWNLILRL